MSIDRDARSRRSRRDPPHERHRSAAGAHPRSEARIRRLTARQEAFLADSTDLETPFLLLDLDVVGERYRALRAALPGADVYYAVKANPAVQVIDLLARLGCRFDVASPGEIRRCTEIGVPASALSYGNTVKRERDVADAARVGVRRFTVDAAAELDKVLRHVHDGTVYIRLATDGAGADWPLSRKFGCSEAEAADLAAHAAAHGLAVGFSFHVGSQQRRPQAWEPPLAAVARLFDRLVAAGARPGGVNLGGGLPSAHLDPTPSIDTYGAVIGRLVDRHLGRFMPLPLMVEPGRFLVGDAGVIQTDVLLVSARDLDPGRRWVYLDIGLFNGLTETLEEAIRYRVRAPGRHGPTGPVVLAGPSCDSADVLYERYEYHLPLDLAIGDRLEILSAGAYTSTYSSVWFNGFEPLRTYLLAVSGEDAA